MAARRTCLLFSSLILLLANVGAIEAQTWKKHTYATDGFQVEFSGDVKISPQTHDAETQKKIVRATDYLEEGGEYAHIVAASLQFVDVNFENGVKLSFAALKCATTTADTPLTFAAGRARELRGTNCHDGNFRVDARYFTVGRWFYQAMAIHPMSGSHVANARRFVESFKVIGK